jgi:hypothetical protein
VADERVQVEVGFEGAQVMIARVTTSSADALDRAFHAGSTSVVDLEAEDGTYAVALTKVVYVKRFNRESRVGFGAG